MAPVLEAQVKSRWARIRYHLMADGLYWTDEFPEDLDSFSENCLRFVLHHRTQLQIGAAGSRWEIYWREAKLRFPNWIGFAPERCAENAKLKKLHRRLSEKGMRDFEAAAKESF